MRLPALLFGVCCAALLAVVAVGRPLPAAAQASCAAVLAEARAEYTRSAFERARLLALRCLQQGEVRRDEELQAYRLLSLVYLRSGDVPNAYDATAELLRLNPQYRPDPVQDPPSYVTFVADVRADLRAAGEIPELRAEDQPPWLQRRGTWLAVGGALVVTGVIAIFAGGS